MLKQLAVKILTGALERLSIAKARITRVLNLLESTSDKLIYLTKKSLKISIVVIPMVIGSIMVLSPKESKKPYLNKALLDQKYTGPSHEDAEYLNRPVIRIVARDKDGDPKYVCSAVVISDYYALTAGHCIVDDSGDIVKETFEIYNDEATLITTAKAAGMYFRPDVGILRGNFTDFNQLDVRRGGNFTESVSGQFLSCGYPQGSKQAFCDRFVFSHIDGFSMVGGGILIPGMSGGPVVDMVTREVVGINVASGYGPANANASLLIGFDVIFEIEP